MSGLIYFEYQSFKSLLVEERSGVKALSTDY